MMRLDGSCFNTQRMRGQVILGVMACFAAAALSACTPALESVPFELSAQKLPAAKDYPRSRHVILKQHRRWLMHWGERYTEHQHHELRYVLNKDGMAAVKRSFPADADVRDLFARIRTPDGRIQEVDPARIYRAEVHGEKGKGKRKVLTFRFPGIEVGSLLEFSYTTRSDGMHHVLRERITEATPILDYQVAIRMDDGIGYKFKIYNTKQRFKHRKIGDLTEYSMHIRDLPERTTKGWEPNWREVEPWWAYREQYFELGRGRRVHLVGSWPDAVRPIAKRLYSPYDKIYANFDHKLKAAECKGDRSCIVDKAWAWVRKRAEWSGFEMLGGVRPLQRVVQSGHGGSWEKSILLWRLLAQEDIQARFALVTRFGSRPVDQGFPDGDAFNHLILLLPGVGSKPDRWLDPTCEYCEPGQVGYWLSGTEGYVLNIEREGGTAKVVPKYRPIIAKMRDEGRFLQVHRVRLDPLGDATIETSVERTGRAAQWYRQSRRTWTKERWRKEAESMVSKHTPWGRLLSSEPAACDRAKGRCKGSWSFSWPGYATPDGEELIVPLSVFNSNWDSWFKDKERARDVVIWGTRREVQRIELEAPEGYVVAALPTFDVNHKGLVASGFSVFQQGRTVTIQRDLEVSHGRHGEFTYPSMRSGVRRYADAKRALLVLRRAPQ